MMVWEHRTPEFGITELPRPPTKDVFVDEISLSDSLKQILFTKMVLESQTIECLSSLNAVHDSSSASYCILYLDKHKYVCVS